jgi:hypothetical protein
MATEPDHSSRFRGFALYVGVVASLLTILAYVTSDSFRTWLQDVWDFFVQDHPEGTSRTLIPTVIVLAVALAIVLMAMIRYRRRIGAFEASAKLSPVRQSDRKLFDEFLGLMPSSTGTIDFLKNGSMASFPRALMDNLREFEGSWNDAEHEFHDQAVETGRRELGEAVSRLLIVMAEVTWPIGDDRQGPPPEWKYGVRHQDYLEAINRLETAAADIVERHQTLVRIARRQLEQ